MTSSVSVTEVRNALRCPRLFALGRQRAAALAFPVGSSCLGATFHRIVDRFAQNAQSPLRPLVDLAAGAALDEIAAALRRSLLDLLVRELESNPSYASMPAEVDDLAEALRELARHLAGRMQKFAEPAAVALGRVVLAGERELEARLDADGPLVRGRIDALYGVQRLGAKARAAGIHIVLATQRPDRDTVPAIIKANLGGKLALKVASGVNSKIILDCGGAERLYGKGDLLADLGRGIVRAQAPLMQ